MEAFRLVCMVYRTAMEEGADDSDGGLSILMDSCEETWFVLLSNATQPQEKEIYQGKYPDVLKEDNLADILSHLPGRRDDTVQDEGEDRGPVLGGI